MTVSRQAFWHILVEIDWDSGFVAFCTEYPGAAGQGETPESAVGNLIEAIDAITYIEEN